MIRYKITQDLAFPHCIYMTITYQDDVCYNFYHGMSEFRASDGMILASEAYPSWSSSGHRILFTRGRQVDKYNYMIIIPIIHIYSVINAINEYNDKVRDV
jgi:hypothetical protein